MSKAFVKESEFEEDEGESSKPDTAPKEKVFMTPAGANRLRDELSRLKYKVRPEITEIITWAAGNGDRSENGDYIYNKRKLREIDSRIRYLSKQLRNLQEIDPLKQRRDQIAFGATVTVADEDGAEKTFKIVGVDEANASKGRISWISPVAQALMKGQKGDVVYFSTPKGRRELEILDFEYQEIALDDD